MGRTEKATSLVEHLQALAELSYPANHVTGVALREAAAEIERLRAALEGLASVAVDHIHNWDTKRYPYLKAAYEALGWDEAALEED